MVEGEHHHRDGQPQGLDEVAVEGLTQRRGFGDDGTVPVRDQVERQAHQSDHEREDQHAHRLDDDLAAQANDRHQTQDQHQGEDGTGRCRHAQLVHHQALDGVGNGHGVHQQDGVDGEEVEQGDELACGLAEVLFHHLGDVAVTGGAGQHEAGQSTVGEEGQRQGQDQHGDQRPQATDTGIDRQEEDTGADGGTVQTQHPDHVGLVDATGGGFAQAAFNCNVHVRHRGVPVIKESGILTCQWAWARFLSLELQLFVLFVPPPRPSGRHSLWQPDCNKHGRGVVIQRGSCSLVNNGITLTSSDEMTLVKRPY